MSINQIEVILKENIKNLDAVFVFPTEIAASLWADRATKITECSSVAMERFLAWDKFKGEAVRGENQNKDPVPSTMRTIFASQLIEENARKVFFKNLIPPDYAKTAGGFANWIASILPSLGVWKDYFDKSIGEKDDEDEDLITLFEKYSSFLNTYNLFDPAWERPPFKSNGKHYFIFFPEINSDWEEYRKILENSKEFISIISLPEEKAKSNNALEYEGEVNFFNNSRIELKNVASIVSELHRKKGIEWAEIAISVPDVELYEPYLDRELKLMEIPHIARIARSLSKTPAGNLFAQIKKCIETKNSYESIKDLLLNRELPWKEPETAQRLIEFGQENHCICSFFYNKKPIDVWEKSFNDLLTHEAALEVFYRKLKTHLENFEKATTFEALRKAYFSFRNTFFDMEKCSEKSNSILSRCITELGGLIDLENKYKECKVPSVLDFFTKQLESIVYLEQVNSRGVQIYSYKTVATAPFACHIIVDSSQTSLSVLYRDLSFLTESKRRRLLNRDEINVSDKFIQLYLINSIQTPAYFTCAQRTLNGYAQPVSYLREINKIKENDENNLFKGNPYGSERKWFLEEKSNKKNFPQKITKEQRQSFENWLNIQPKGDSVTVRAAEAVANLNAGKDESGHEKTVYVSKSLLSKFYDCPRKWLLDSHPMGIEIQDNAAQLMDKYSEGNLYHKILEIYCQNLMEKELPLRFEENGLSEEYAKILEKAIDEAINYNGFGSDKNCYLKRELLKTARQSVRETIFTFVEKFSKIFNNCKVAQTEASFSLTNNELNYSFNGRIDCLLQDLNNMQYYLVDFKNTKYAVPDKKTFFVTEAPKEEKSVVSEVPDEGTELPLEEQELPDFQMPAYIYLMENQENPLKIENAAFFAIKEAQCFPVFGKSVALRADAKNALDFPNYDDFRKTVAKMIECVENYALRIHKGDFSLDDNVQTYGKCAGCDYSSVCRRTFNVANKRGEK